MTNEVIEDSLLGIGETRVSLAADNRTLRDNRFKEEVQLCLGVKGKCIGDATTLKGVRGTAWLIETPPVSQPLR